MEEINWSATVVVSEEVRGVIDELLSMHDNMLMRLYNLDVEFMRIWK